MSPSIIQEPVPDEGFYSPELTRFAAAAIAVMSAAWALYGLWFVNDVGCFDGDCGGPKEDGWGLGIYLLLFWITGQVVLTAAAIGGLVYLNARERSHRTSLVVSTVSIVTSLILIGAAATAIWFGT